MKGLWKLLSDIYDSPAVNLQLNHWLLSFTSVMRLSCKIDLCKSNALSDVWSSGWNVINFDFAERFVAATFELLFCFFYSPLTWEKNTLLEELPPPLSQPSVLFFRLVVDEVCKVTLLSPSSGKDSNYRAESRLLSHMFFWTYCLVGCWYRNVKICLTNFVKENWQLPKTVKDQH